MVIISPLQFQAATFLDVLNALGVLVTSSTITGDPGSGFFGAVSDHDDFDLSFEVFGRDFEYDLSRDFALTEGIVESVIISSEDAGELVEVIDLDLDASTIGQAAAPVLSGQDTGAFERFLLGLDYDYRSSGLDEVAPRSLISTEGVPFDPSGDDVFRIFDGGTHDFFAGAGDDEIYADVGFDTLVGGPGDDFISPWFGGDTVRGGSGEDTVLLWGLQGAGVALLRHESVGSDVVFAADRADRAYDGIRGVELYTDGVQTIGRDEVPFFDGLAYGASNPEALADLGTDDEALFRHFLEQGHHDGLGVTFDASQYLANYADLRAAFGDDEDAAARHFIRHGFEEGRLPSDPLDYIASFPDLIAAFGGLSAADMRAAGLRHFKRNGFEEGRADGIDFDADDYLANYADLRAAFGTNDAAATLHYVRAGSDAGRLPEDALRYLASFGDLIEAADAAGLTSEAELRGFAARHFRLHGEEEGRLDRVDFDTDAYIGNYGFVRDAAADGDGGYDADPAHLDYILSGYFEGTTDDLLPV